MELCSIASGSSGNCIFVGGGRTRLLIDTGISGKRVEEGLSRVGVSPRELAGILITHEHIDHIQGLGVMSRRYHLPVYATKGTIEAIRHTASLGKLPEEIFCPIYADQPFRVGELSVKPFAISHDAADPVGYRVEHGGRALAVATDMGIYNDYIVNRLSNLNAVLLEANHDEHMLDAGPYPYPLKRRIAGPKGHLSNLNAGRLLCEILHPGLTQILLGHLSQENNYEALAYETVACELASCEGARRKGTYEIRVAKRGEISPLIKV